jgi:hypothetical protein
MLAPGRPNARTAFVRAGFFHWYELTDRDKQAVLAEARPILRDPATFQSLAPAVWQLTHDFGYLRRANGGDYSSLLLLRDLAATRGFFDDYRGLRDAAVRRLATDFATKAAAATAFDPIDFVRLDSNTADQPLLERILDELHDHPLDKHPSNPVAVNRLIDYAIRHGLQPLDGLEFIVREFGSATAPARARLAVALGDIKRANLIETAAGVDTDPEWYDYFVERAAYERAHGEAAVGLSYAARANATRAKVLLWVGQCSGDQICTSAHRSVYADSPRRYSITIARMAGDDVPPYVEVYVDDARIGEGPIEGEQTFNSDTLAAGMHRVHVRVVNPFTRNLAQRRVRVLREVL